MKQASNFRNLGVIEFWFKIGPVSSALLSFDSKYMEANKLFPHGQHGFRANRSTFSALANMQETWLKAYESGNNISLRFSIYPALLIQFQKKYSIEN